MAVFSLPSYIHASTHFAIAFNISGTLKQTFNGEKIFPFIVIRYFGINIFFFCLFDSFQYQPKNYNSQHHSKSITDN